MLPFAERLEVWVALLKRQLGPVDCLSGPIVSDCALSAPWNAAGTQSDHPDDDLSERALAMYDVGPHAEEEEAADTDDVAIVLVGCCREKGARPGPAKDLYQSNRFRLSAAWAIAHGLPWLILSGRHGLVDPDESIAPYDFDLRSAGSEATELWAMLVVTALRKRCGEIGRVVILASDDYAIPVAVCLREVGIRCELPLIGRSAAERQERLRAMLGMGNEQG